MSKATKKAKPKDASARTMVTLYETDLAAIEKLRKRFYGLSDTRYHSEVMRRAVIYADEKGIGTPSAALREACETPGEDEEPTKHAVVLRGLEAVLDRFQKKHRMDSTSSALRLCLRTVAAIGE